MDQSWTYSGGPGRARDAYSALGDRTDGRRIRRAVDPLRTRIFGNVVSLLWREADCLEPGEEKTPEQELTDDLLALIASFSGRLYGMRSHKQKELLQCAQAVLTSP